MQNLMQQFCVIDQNINQAKAASSNRALSNHQEHSQ